MSERCAVSQPKTIWPLANSIATATVLVWVAGVASGPLLVATFSMRQKYAPRNLLAQVSTAGASLKIGAYALGAAAGGWLVPTVGALPAIGFIAGLHVVAAGCGYLAGRGASVPIDHSGTDGLEVAAIPAEA